MHVQLLRITAATVDTHRHRPAKPSLLDGIINALKDWRYQPGQLSDLRRVLDASLKKRLIDTDSRKMIDGVLGITNLTASDVMVAAPKMQLIAMDASMDECFAILIEVGHSRYPVYEGSKENIVGLLHAKDILKLQRTPELSMKALVRPAMFLPESKRLIDLLREFRKTRTHMAILVDEFGRVGGLVTLEDVLEEIVGEIEDEFDKEEQQTDIFSFSDNSYRVSGRADIEVINHHFDVQLPNILDEERFDTIGGLISHAIGHVPMKGESHVLEGLQFTVLHVRGGAVTWFRVKKIGWTPSAGAPSEGHP